ncbi:MAG: ABC transporter substrate-binding protein [Leucobacter sp.]|nr:ABC transporter substrate-binding protein [Leucobacter sp.]
MFKSITQAPRSGKRRTWGLLAAAAAGALALSACASSGTTPTPAPDEPDAPANSSQVQDALVPYVGGTAGAADSSQSPIRIGYITQEGGIPSFPESLAAAQAAASLVNEQLGGVKGQPIELVPCIVVSSQEEALACAQQMANDDSIAYVQMSLLTVGTESIYSTLAGKKAVVGQTPASPTDVTTADLYQPWPGSFGVQGGIAKYVSDTLQAKQVAIVYDDDDPGSSFGAKSLAGALDQLKVAYNSVGTQTGSPDVASALVSAGAMEADVVVRVGSTPSCVPTAQAIEQLGITAPVIGLDFCTDDSVREANGGDLPAWTYVGQAQNVFAPENNEQVAVYRAAMASFAPDAKYSGLAPYGWNAVLLGTKMLNELGADGATPAAVADWWEGFNGPLFMGPESIECGFLADAGLRGLCSTAVFFTEYDGNGAWKPSIGVDSRGLGLK